MSSNKNLPNDIFNDFLQGLIALDLEERENLHPILSEGDIGGIQFWQLQQSIEELAGDLIQYESQFDELAKDWEKHPEHWGRYLGPAAIQFARNLIDDPEYEDEEFAMDWVVPSEENPGSE